MTDPLSEREDIVEAAEKVERYTEGMTYETFVHDEQTVDAVLRNVAVMGEAAKNVPDDVRAEYDHVPRPEMAGMRDKLIHGYATIDLEIIWTTVRSDLPEILPVVRAVTAEIERLEEE